MKFVYTSSGERLSTHTLGKGSKGKEGVVYGIDTQPNIVAKIFHRDDKENINLRTPERLYKLEVMLRNVPQDYALKNFQHRSLTFPEDILYNSSGTTREFVGFLMPKLPKQTIQAVGALSIDPSVRHRIYNNQFIRVASAANLAGLINSLHSSGYVVGDINRQNLYFSTDPKKPSLVTLIDLDSMQIANPQGGYLRSTVGFPDYTPPELMGVPFHQVDRQTYHDNFALACLVFQILYNGFHPFQNGDKNDEKLNIKHNSSYYVYDKKPPNGAPSFDILPASLSGLFLRAFSEGFKNPSSRPTAQEWQHTLIEYQKELKKCSHDEDHYFNPLLLKCPWCTNVKKNVTSSTPLQPSKKTTEVKLPPKQTSMSGSGQAVATSQSTPSQGQSTSKMGTSKGVKSVGTKTQHGSQARNFPQQPSRFMRAGRLYLSHLTSVFPSNKAKFALLVFFFVTAFIWVNTNVLAYYTKKDAFICYTNQYTNGESFTDYDRIKIPNKLGAGSVFHSDAPRLTSQRKRYNVTPVIENGKPTGRWEGEYLGSYELIQDREGYMVWKTPPNTRRWNGEVYGYLKRDSRATGSVIAYGKSKLECGRNFKTGQQNIDNLRAEYAYSWQDVKRPQSASVSDTTQVNREQQQQAQEEIKKIRREELDRARYSKDFKDMVNLKKNMSNEKSAAFRMCWATEKNTSGEYDSRQMRGLTTIADVEPYDGTKYPNFDMILRQVARTVDSPDNYIYEYVGTGYQDLTGSSGRRNLDLYALYVKSDGSLKQIGLSNGGDFMAIARTTAECNKSLEYAFTISSELEKWAHLAWEEYYGNSSLINASQNRVSTDITNVLLNADTTIIPIPTTTSSQLTSISSEAQTITKPVTEDKYIGVEKDINNNYTHYAFQLGFAAELRCPTTLTYTLEKKQSL